MVLLTSLWIVTASPLNTLKGRIPSWKAVEVTKDLSKAKTKEVRNIEKDGHTVDADRGREREGGGRREPHPGRGDPERVAGPPAGVRPLPGGHRLQGASRPTRSAGASRTRSTSSSRTIRCSPSSSSARRTRPDELSVPFGTVPPPAEVQAERSRQRLPRPQARPRIAARAADRRLRSRRCCCSGSVCSRCTGARRTSARPRRPRRAAEAPTPAVPEKV